MPHLCPAEEGGGKAGLQPQGQAYSQPEDLGLLLHVAFVRSLWDCKDLKRSPSPDSLKSS